MSLARFDYDTPLTVLVVDSSPDLVDLFGRFLSRQGILALPAPTVQRCLEEAKQSIVDVIVVGLTMPGVDGLEVCSVVKQSAFTRAIPLVLLTDKNDIAIQLAAMRLGVSELVLRPIRAQDLLTRIQVHIEFSRKAREMDRVLTQGIIEAANLRRNSLRLKRERGNGKLK